MDCLTLKKSNCKNCYKCIRHCPVKSIRFSGNQAYIIGNECILCGQCFVVCPQDAKQIVDETEKVKVLLQSSDPVRSFIRTLPIRPHTSFSPFIVSPSLFSICSFHLSIIITESENEHSRFLFSVPHFLVFGKNSAVASSF